MLTQEMNSFLTRTGPGTPMGELFRRYWIPGWPEWELPERDGPPVRVKLVGEKLVALRDTEGRIGLVDEFCAHRGVSLWFGRNEECGLRCAYHGWKYDVNGQCVDLPSEPEESRVRQRIKLKSYPCVELGGVIWTYMGPLAEKPPLPNFEWVQLPPSHRVTTKRWAPTEDENRRRRWMTFHPPPPIHKKHTEHIKDGNGVHAELIPGTFRPVANRSNDYLMDRAKQKSGRHYNGVKGLAMQDASIQESIGPIADRTKEKLQSTDKAITMARQRLIKA